MSRRLAKSCTLLVCILLSVRLSEQVIRVSRSVQEENLANGNRRKFQINLSSNEQNSGSQIMDHIGDRFRRYVKGSDESKIKNNPFHFNDTHLVAEVHWSGSNSSAIMILMKDQGYKMSPLKPSHFFVSRDYGKHFENITDRFKLSNGTTAVISDFFSSTADDRRYILVAKFHKVMFISSDECLTFINRTISFHPSEVKYHPTHPWQVLAHEGGMGLKGLYSSSNYGNYWYYKSYNVTSYSWSYPRQGEWSTYFYYLKEGINSIGSLMKSRPGYYWYWRYSYPIESNVTQFELINQYMFVEKPGDVYGTKDLYISLNRKKFKKAIFPFTDKKDHISKGFIIADASENETMVAVSHENGTANLYISNKEATKFSLSLPGILYYEEAVSGNYFGHDFVDMMRVKGVSGVYIATNLTDIVKRYLVSWITFDKGGEWTLLKPPITQTSKNCSYSNGCSLHVSHEYGYHAFTRFSPMYSKKSAPGFILATGNVGRSLSKHPYIYLSTDAGMSWKVLFQGHYFYGFVDHGGIILAVKKYGKVDTLQYSWNEGHSWNVYRFTDTPMRVYGLLTEPGEKTTIFTVFGSKPEKHSWLIIQIDMKDVLGKPCTKNDYMKWVLTDMRNNSEHCSLGKKQTYERRLDDSKCFNGINYDRPITVANCMCAREDYMCDFGYREIEFWFGSYCDHDTNYVDYSKTTPDFCRPGLLYNISKGYRKIPGDTCEGGVEALFRPETKACPFNNNASNFFLYAKSSHIYRYDIDKDVQIPIELNGMRNVIALDYGYSEEVLFYADHMLDSIMMLNFSSGYLQKLLQFDQSSVYVEGLAYDWMNKNLYYADAGRATIGVIPVRHFRYKFQTQLLGPNVLGKPRGIAVHPAKGYMFYTDRGTKPGIYRAMMDGTSAKQVISTNIETPNSVTIDYKNNRIYWADSTIKRIESSDLEGNVRKVIISSSNYELRTPYGLDILKDKVYWTDWGAHYIKRIGISGGSTESVVGWVYKAMALKAFWPGKQQNVGNGCQRNQCSHICLPLGGDKHACKCPDVLTLESSNNKTCSCASKNEKLNSTTGVCDADNGKNCTVYQFMCHATRECIPSHWRCDKDNDCGDFSDERNCNGSQCPAGRFSCGDGRCILDSWKCDNQTDCHDGSDEKNCPTIPPHTCPSNHVRCPSGDCISISWLCDGMADCTDGFDESNCTHTVRPTTPTGTGTIPKLRCGVKEFQCVRFQRMRCLPLENRCDGDFDCDDQSDEKKCTDEKCKKSLNSSTCDNGTHCYTKSQKCDGHHDCADRTDEYNCPTTTNAPYTGTVWCPNDQYKCDGGRVCYSNGDICNDIPNCRDRNDERNCDRKKVITTLKPSCNASSFICDSGRCIAGDRRCDGSRDCRFGEDEDNCNKIVSCKLPKPFKFMCDQLSCFNASVQCDGLSDCDDNSDEDKSICDLTKRVSNLTVVNKDNNQLLIKWKNPKFFVNIGDFQGYRLKSTSLYDAKNKLTVSDYNTKNQEFLMSELQPCTEYLIAVAINLKSLNNKLLYVDVTGDTGGYRKPDPEFEIEVTKDYLRWKENNRCTYKYTKQLQGRELLCWENTGSDAINPNPALRLKIPNSEGFIRPQEKFPNNTRKKQYNCQVTLTYAEFISESRLFDFPLSNVIHSPSTGTNNNGKGKNNTNVLIWAIPVSLVAIALVLGLVVMVYKYRRLQHSFLAFAARGSYTRHEDMEDGDELDDSMVVEFRTGEDAPMINRFSDDEPLVVG